MDRKDKLVPPHTVDLPPPPRKAEVPPAPSLPIDDEPQLDSVALATAEPSPLLEQPYPQHQLIAKQRTSGILLRTLFFASVGFGLGILIGVGFLLG